MEFFAIAENESKARVKFNFLQVCVGATFLLLVCNVMVAVTNYVVVTQ